MIKINGKKLNSFYFPNKEWCIDTDLDLNEGINVIEFAFQDNSSLLELLFVLSHLDDLSVNDWEYEGIRLIIQYMPYSRMDRSQNGSCFTLKHVYRILQSVLPVKTDVYIVEPHSDASLSLCREANYHEAKPVFIAPWLAVNVLDLHPEISVICYPDKGARKRYSGIVPVGMHTDVVHCDKIRDFDSGKITGLSLSDPDRVKDKSVLILDDLCSKGTTFYYTAQKLKEAGAKEVYLAVTHVERTIKEGELLTVRSPIAHIYATDTLTERGAFHERNITIVPIDKIPMYASLLEV